MPPSYVTTLRDELPSRPPLQAKIVQNAIIVHGLQDNDEGGSASWRVREYASAVNTCGTKVRFYEPNVDHSLEPWLSASSLQAEVAVVPTLISLLESLLA